MLYISQSSGPLTSTQAVRQTPDKTLERLQVQSRALVVNVAIEEAIIAVLVGEKRLFFNASALRRDNYLPSAKYDQYVQICKQMGDQLPQFLLQWQMPQLPQYLI